MKGAAWTKAMIVARRNAYFILSLGGDCWLRVGKTFVEGWGNKEKGNKRVDR